MTKLRLFFFSASWLLAACASQAVSMQSGSQMPSVSALRGSVPDSGYSWIARDAKRRDLLYVSNNRNIKIYSYPRLRMEGTIRTGLLQGGECTDAKGDVFVTNTDNGEIIEYAHGENKPIAVLHNPTADPLGCAIDPITGNLAVASLGFEDGSVAIYPNATGSPTTYTSPAFIEFDFCGYDNAGNLFVDGNSSPGSGNFAFAELPKGGSGLETVSLNQYISWPGGVEWDGKHITVGDQTTPVIYQFAVSGSSGTEVGSISFGGGAEYVAQYEIFGKHIIVPNMCVGSCSDVLIYDYPAGGNAIKSISDGISYPEGVVVSRVKR